MTRTFLALLLVPACWGYVPSAKAADDAGAIVDQAIRAMGGAQKLEKAKALTWKTKGKLFFGDNENSYKSQVTASGISKFRSQFEGEFNGNSVKGVLVLNGDKAWRLFGEMGMELDEEAVANEKRSVYLQIIPVASLLPLKSKEFRTETAAADKSGDAETDGVKVTGPDGKDFTLYFDKSTHLPVKAVARVRGFGGDEFTQETSYSDYKDFDGFKRPSRIKALRDGQTFLDAEIGEFKALDEVDPATFSEPK